MENVDSSNWSINDWANFWRYEIGVNVTPADTQFRKRYIKWKNWQDKSIPKEVHEKWIKENAFEGGMAIIPGKVWRGSHQDKYLIFIDLDNQKGVDEICNIFNVSKIDELSRIVIVEQHKDDKSKAHIYFYSETPFKKKSSDISKFKDGIKNNEVPAIEVKGKGSHGIAFCCPSLHKNGYNYEIIEKLEPKTFGNEIENKLVEIYDKYNLQVDKNGEVPINKLFEKNCKIHQGHNRHEALLRVMESLFQRNKKILSLEEIKQLSRNWNFQHCQPPLDEKEFEKQWHDAQKFIEVTNNVVQHLHPRIEKNSYTDKNEKKYLIYRIVEHSLNPKIYYIDNEAKEIIYGSINWNNKFIPKYTITDISPTKITIYSNPFLRNNELTEIFFSNGLKIGPCNSINDIIRILENKGHVLNKLKIHDAVNAIISAFKDNKLIEHKEEVTTSGYYYNKEKLIVKDITQTLKIKKEDVEKCCDYLNELAHKGWINKNILPTVIKWAIIAPFSFIIKYNSSNWFPWLQLYGQSQTGKTTLGLIVLCIWNLQPKDHSLGFNHIDTVPRFGNIISRDTYPKLINEVGTLSFNSYGKYTNLIETIKISIENTFTRGKFETNNSGYGVGAYQQIPALSPMIFTSNYQPVRDSGYHRRMISIHFSKIEKKEENEQESFKQSLEENKQYLSTLGEFTSLYLQEHPQELFKYPWKDLSFNILTQFYRFANKTVPDWIEYFEKQSDAIDESYELTHFELRAFLLTKINETYSKYSKINTEENNKNDNIILSKICFCLKHKLIPFLHFFNDNNIVITIDIMSELKNNNIENITSLHDVGTLLNLNYTNMNFFGKKRRLLYGQMDNLLRFLDLEIK